MSDENKEKIMLCEMKVAINLNETDLISPFEALGTEDGKYLSTEDGKIIAVETAQT